MTIYFIDEPSIVEPFFIGADDDPFLFESNVASLLGYSSITTVPANYVYENNIIDIIDHEGLERSSFGMSTIMCEYTL